MIGIFCVSGSCASRMTAVALSVAVSSASSSSEARSGAIAISPITSPRWRKPTELVALRASPPSRASEARVNGGSASPSPTPASASAGTA